jgi:hypothetical protein
MVESLHMKFNFQQAKLIFYFIEFEFYFRRQFKAGQVSKKE